MGTLRLVAKVFLSKPRMVSTREFPEKRPHKIPMCSEKGQQVVQWSCFSFSNHSGNFLLLALGRNALACWRQFSARRLCLDTLSGCIQTRQTSTTNEKQVIAVQCFGSQYDPTVQPRRLPRQRPVVRTTMACRRPMVRTWRANYLGRGDFICVLNMPSIP